MGKSFKEYNNVRDNLVITKMCSRCRIEFLVNPTTLKFHLNKCCKPYIRPAELCKRKK